MVKVDELLILIRGDNADFNKALKNTRGGIDKIAGVATKATAAVAAAGAAAGAGAVKAAIDFESAFAGVKKTVDATDEQLATLRKGILDMSKELPASAGEIAAVSEAAGQLGIQTENVLGFTRTMIDLGEATNLSATDAATSLARLANITQLPQDQFDNLGSTVVALGNNLATTEAEIVEMGLRLAGAGSQVGLTQAQILSFGGALSSVGVAAEAGGTAFSRVFVTMDQAARNGGDSLAKFAEVAGVSAEDFATAFGEDAAGATSMFIKGLGDLQGEGANVFAILDELELGDIRVRDSLLRAAGAGDLFTDALALGSKAWEENTALTKEAEQRYETTASKLAMMKNQVTAVGIQLGDALLPALLQVTENIGPLAEQLAPSIERLMPIIVAVAGALADALGQVGPLLDGIVDIVTDVAEAFMAGMGSDGAGGAAEAAATAVDILTTALETASPILQAIGFLFGALMRAVQFLAPVLGPVAGVILAVAAAMKVWAAIQAVMNFLLLANPIGLVVLAIAALIGIVVLLVKHWDVVKEATAAAWEWIKNAIVTVVDFLVGLFLNFTIVGLIIKHWDTIKEGTIAAWNAVVSFLGGVWTSIRDTVVGVWNGITGVFSGAWDKFKEIGGDILQGIVDGFLGIKDKVIDTAKGVWDGIKSGVKSFFGISSPSKEAKTWGTAIMDGVQIAMESGKAPLLNAAARIWGGVKDGVKSFFGIASPSKESASWATAIMDGFRRNLMPLGDVVKNSLGSVQPAVNAIIQPGALSRSAASLAGPRSPRPIQVGDVHVTLPLTQTKGDFDPKTAARQMRAELLKVLRESDRP